jgi:hypothetical protein
MSGHRRRKCTNTLAAECVFHSDYCGLYIRCGGVCFEGSRMPASDESRQPHSTILATIANWVRGIFQLTDLHVMSLALNFLVATAPGTAQPYQT